MNKLITKISALALGLGLAVGVGVGLGQSKKVDVARAADITSPVSLSDGTYDTDHIVWGLDNVITIQQLKGSGSSNVNSSYISAPRVYKGHILSFVASEGTKIKEITFTINGTYYGSAMTAGTVVEDSVVTNNTTDVARSWTSTSGGTHVVSSVSDEGLSAIYIQNVASPSNVQLRFTALSIKYSSGSESLEDLTIKNSSGDVGPFDDLNSKFVGGYMFYSYDENNTQKAAAFSISDSTVADLQDNEDGSCCVTPKKPGILSLYAELDGYNKAAVLLTFNYPYEHTGTSSDDPFTIEEALVKCGEGSTDNWYVTGIISYYEKFDTKYNSCYYYLSDDGTRSNELYIYSGKDIGNVNFTSETASTLVAGKIAVVYGILKTYNSICEMDKNNYLISLENQPTGDINVTFSDSNALCIGDNGTYTAETDGTNPTFTWESSAPSVLSVDESTGEYEALSLGTARITVSVSAVEGEGQAYIDVTVSSSESDVKTVDEARTIAASLDSGTTTQYYIYVGGYVSGFDFDGQQRGIIISNENETSTIIIFTGKSSYSSFIADLLLGDHVVIKGNVQNYSGTYEITNSPELISSHYSAKSFANYFLQQTNTQCSSYVDGESDYDEFKIYFEGIWSYIDDEYNNDNKLDATERAKIVDSDAKEGGTTIEQAMARYDLLVSKYQLDNFITGRVIDGSSYVPSTIATNNNTDMLIVIVAFGVSTLFFVTLCVVRKRKGLRK